METTQKETTVINDGKNSCMCGHHGYRHHMKWLVRLAVIVVVFALGFMMGQLHGMMRGGMYSTYGNNSMMRGGDDRYMMRTRTFEAPTTGVTAPQPPVVNQ